MTSVINLPPRRWAKLSDLTPPVTLAYEYKYSFLSGGFNLKTLLYFHYAAPVLVMTPKIRAIPQITTAANGMLNS